MLKQSRPFEILPPSTIVAQGKTKRIHRFESPLDRVCAIRSLDDLTAFNAKKKGGFPGKGALCTTVTCNHFARLRRQDIPVAFYEQWNEDTFIAPYCRMIKLEVVARFVADPRSSYVKRYPDIAPGTRFQDPVIEFFLKTTNGQLDGRSYPCDDPYLVPVRVSESETGFEIYYPDREPTPENKIGTISADELYLSNDAIKTMRRLMHRAAIVLRDGWAPLGDQTDWKGEFGTLEDGSILFADVIDNDSHRLWIDGIDRSKQGWRDDTPIDEVIRNYQMVADLSNRFPF